MSLLDVLFLLVLVLSVVSGLVRGLVREVLSLAGLVAGFLLAAVFAPALAPQLERWMPHPAAYGLAFLLIVLVVAVVAGILGTVLTKALEALQLSCLNRVLGGVFGFVRGALLIIVLFWGLLFFVGRPERLIAKSRLAPLVYRGAVWLSHILPGHEEPPKGDVI